MVRIVLLTFGFAAAAALSGCQTVDTTKAGVVGVDRDQRMMVSAEEVNAGSAKASSATSAPGASRSTPPDRPAGAHGLVDAASLRQ